MAINSNLKAIFNKYAGDYNKYRRQLIPCFDDLYSTAVDVIPFKHDEQIKVLDLGAGTGLFSFFVASVYENSNFVLVDVSERMLEQAKLTLSKLPNKYNYFVKDYTDLLFVQPTDHFDLVISALSIHHLSESQKIKVFERIYAYLKSGGIFINIDQVQGETPEIDKCYREKWVSQVRNNKVTEAELNAAYERMREDKMSTIKSQMQWLKGAGFAEVNCWYKNFSFVVYSGCK